MSDHLVISRQTTISDDGAEHHTYTAREFPEEILFDSGLIGTEDGKVLSVDLIVKIQVENGFASYRYQTKDRKVLGFSVPMKRVLLDLDSE